MRRRNAWIVALGLLGHAACLSAGENLIARSGWVRFQVAFGRLAAVPRSRRLREDSCYSDPLSSTSQSHWVRAEDGAAHAHYLLESPQERLCVDWQPDGRFELTYDRQAHHVRLLQVPDGPLRLAVVVAGEGTTVEANDLWSLLLTHPTLCDEHLAPHLRRLRPDLKLAEQRQRIVGELLRVATEQRPCRKVVLELVDKLGADKYRQRQRAENVLLQLGPGVLRYLDELEPHQLDAEQTFRIARVREHYQAGAADCCERVAAWLAPLPSTWLTLMEHADEVHRQRAFAALCNTCGDPMLVFNPSAAPDARRAQIAKLQSQLAAD